VKVADVMNGDVVTVGLRTPLKDVARLLVERRISGVPVLDDDDTVLGVVSEADILVKERGRAGSSLSTVCWSSTREARSTALVMRRMR
jgi:CBS-domain-containing membrane protein